MEPEAQPYRLLLADDHTFVRAGMRVVLEAEPDFAVVGEAQDGEEAVELCRSLSPDLILMDVRMPNMDGLEATRTIKAERPETVVLVVTAHAGEDYLLEAVRAGAAGYVLKDAPKHELLGAVRRALTGESPIDQELAMRLLRRLIEEHRPGNQPPPRAAAGKHALPGSLSARELDVLRQLCAGKTNRQIAQELHLSLSTVKTYLGRVLSKLEVSDRTQAAVKAVQLGLLPERGNG